MTENTDTVAIETESVSGSEADIFSPARPRLLRLKRLRAGSQVGYLCLRATSDFSWILTRHYDVEVFGFKGHDRWEGDGLIKAVINLLVIVDKERDDSLNEFRKAVSHLTTCANLEKQGLAKPPKGFRAGWARAMIPTARDREQKNLEQWRVNLIALKTRLEETGWPVTPFDSLTSF